MFGHLVRVKSKTDPLLSFCRRFVVSPLTCVILQFEFGSHFTAYMLEAITGSRFCFENGLDTVIQSIGKHQVMLDLQVTRENPSWKSICLVRFIFATLDAMACVPIEMCAARLQEI